MMGEPMLKLEFGWGKCRAARKKPKMLICTSDFMLYTWCR
jgi:hypothetical protein